MSTNDRYDAGPTGRDGVPPPPGAYPPPPPSAATAARRSRRWPLIAAGVIVGFLLLIGGCTLLVLRAASGPIDAANEFLADVAAGDWDAASDHLDPSCFDPDATTAASLLGFFGNDVTSYNLTSTSNQNGNRGASGGSITRASFGTQDIEFALSKPADDWLICGFRIGNG